MERRFTILVTVPEFPAQSGHVNSYASAFRLVEQAIAEYVERHEDLVPDGIQVHTSDGTQSTVF